MLSTLLLNNIHLSVELLGGMVFIIIGWLFAEAFRIKKDIRSFGRFSGFWLLAAWQTLHAIYGEFDTGSISFYIYTAGLAIIFLSYLEKLPARPKNIPSNYAFAGFTPLFYFFSTLSTVFLFATTAILYRRFSKDIDKLINWLLFGFAF